MIELAQLISEKKRAVEIAAVAAAREVKLGQGVVGVTSAAAIECSSEAVVPEVGLVRQQRAILPQTHLASG
jgi:hypothetical protein